MDKQSNFCEHCLRLPDGVPTLNDEGVFWCLFCAEANDMKIDLEYLKEFIKRIESNPCPHT